MIPLRDENPSRTTPFVTRIIILVNILVYVFMWITRSMDAMTLAYGMRPALILQGKQLYTLLTSMFIHGGIVHIGGNMLYLFIFGDNVEDAFGHLRFLLFYGFCGLIADLTHVATTNDLMIPTIGASGAISGVLGAYFILYPRARVLTLIIAGWIFMTRIPAILLLGFWFILQLFSGMLTLTAEISSGVAYWAHIGGFAAGMIIALIFRRL